MIATGDNDTQVSSPARATSLPRGLDLLWHARGWWGGLIALGLAARGQDVLINGNDAAAAGTYYLLAMVLLIAVWLHPALPWRRASGAPPLPAAEAPAAVSPPAPAGDAPVEQTPPMGTPTGTQQVASTLPTRRVRGAAAEPAPAPIVVPEPAAVAPVAAHSRPRAWARWKALRARLGWRLTA